MSWFVVPDKQLSHDSQYVSKTVWEFYSISYILKEPNMQVGDV